MSKHLDFLNRWAQPLKSRIMSMVGRCIVKVIDDSKDLQIIQLKGFDNETLEDVENVQDYGFAFHPPKDTSEAVIVCLGGQREGALAIRVANRTYRLKNLAEGEVALYSDEGDKIHFQRGNILEDTTQKRRMVLNTLKVNNSSEEMVTVLVDEFSKLVDLLKEIISARTATLLGPQPLIGLTLTFPVIQAQLDIIKSRLETFKE